MSRASRSHAGASSPITPIRKQPAPLPQAPPSSFPNPAPAQKESPADATRQGSQKFLAITYSRPEGLPSAGTGLASVFGMGTGVSPPVRSPGNSYIRPPPDDFKSHTCQLNLGYQRTILGRSICGCVSMSNSWRLAPSNHRLIWSSHRALVPVSSMHFCTYTSGLSTWWSTRALQVRRPWNPYLGVGFPLRCFQRLSFPDLATQRCP